jgi:hypothetical protein
VRGGAAAVHTGGRNRATPQPGAFPGMGMERGMLIEPGQRDRGRLYYLPGQQRAMEPRRQRFGDLAPHRRGHGDVRGEFARKRHQAAAVLVKVALVERRFGKLAERPSIDRRPRQL